MRKLLVIGLCLSMILGLCACGTKDTDKKTDSKKEDTKVESTVENNENKTDEKETDESESESIQTESDTGAESEESQEEEWITIVDENQMFDWTNVTVKGSGLQEDNGYGWEDEKVNNFTASINDAASKVMSTYPCGTYEDRVTFCKVDEYGRAKHSSNVEMYYDKDADKIKKFSIEMYTSNEFYLNDIQLAEVRKPDISEKLGEPYVILKDLESSSYNEYYVWRYNGGYIMINFMIKARYVYVIQNEYTDTSPLLSEFLATNK